MRPATRAPPIKHPTAVPAICPDLNTGLGIGVWDEPTGEREAEDEGDSADGEVWRALVRLDEVVHVESLEVVVGEGWVEGL